MKLEIKPENAIFLALLTSAIAAGCGSSDSSSGSGGTQAKGGTGGTVDAGSGGSSGASGSGGTGGGTAGTSSGGGAGAPMGGSAGLPSPRRPFLVGTSLRSAKSGERDDWIGKIEASALELDAPTRAALREAWLQDALEEHASVAAFARATLLLLSAGAPAELVRDCQRASLEEIEHARGCFALASRYAGAPLGPSALELAGAFDDMSIVSFARLVAEEGAVGETLGAIVAREQLAVTSDGAARAVLERLIRDETRHAALSWSMAAWLVNHAGAAVRAAFFDAAERALGESWEMPERPLAPGVDVGAWHAHGRVTCAEAKQAMRRAIDEVVRPALAELRRGTRLEHPAAARALS